MLNILVAGGFDPEGTNADHVRAFGEFLGAEIVSQGHKLVNSCRTDFDRIVAGAAEARLLESKLDPKQFIVSYVMRSKDPAHCHGMVRQSRLDDWELGSPGLKTPEPIESADAVIVVGGFHGTHRAANWARIAGKPLLPVARFTGAGREIYYEELDRFERIYSSKLERTEFENLSDITSEPEVLAKMVVDLVERVRTSRNVFVVMSFANDPDLEDAYDTFRSVCDAEGYDCARIDDESAVPRILPEILARISGCAFVIVDLTDERPNVYYELGFVDGLGKAYIVTARHGTTLPFDVKDIPVTFWKNQKSLREQLSKKVQQIASTQGL